MYLIDVRDVNMGTKNLGSFYDGVFIDETMGQREGHGSITGLCTLVRPYNIQGQEKLG